MHNKVRCVLIAVAAASIVHPCQILAAAAASNVRGTIEHVSGDTMRVKESNGTSVTVHLAHNAKVTSVARATLADIKPGTFIGTAATPQPDGNLQAIEVHIFPESMRGTGEGYRPWDSGPGSSMTNGTVGQEVNKVQGNALTVKYRGGDKVVTVTPSTTVVVLVPASRNDLKPNEKVFIPGATAAGNGRFEASRVTVGKNGVAPPM